jgi:hypothetical protein
MEQTTHVKGLPDAKQQREGNCGVNSSNKKTEEKQANECGNGYTCWHNKRQHDGDDTSQANPRDEEVEGEWGRRERNGKGMKERTGLRSNAKAKGGTGNTHELGSEDKDIEHQVANTEDGGTNPKRQKNFTDRRNERQDIKPDKK